MNQGIDDLLIAEPVAGARVGQQVRTVGHGFHAARGDHFGFPGHYGLRSQRDCFQPGTADFIDGHCRDPGSAAGLQSGLAGGVLTKSRLDDVPENRFINLPGIQTGPARGLGNNLGAKLRSGKSSKAALELANGRANG